MPELPEIETICRGIKPILRQKISSVIIKNYNLRLPIAKNLAKNLKGQRIEEIKRRGKYILLKTPNYTLIVHLGMSGNLQIKPKEHVFSKHEHVNIIFANNLALCYNDPRRFGLILLVDKDPLQHKLLKKLGVEPLENELTAQYLFDQSRGRKISIKQFIMDSKIMVGVGNIYASEALFTAKINPKHKASSVSFERFQILVKKIKEILASAIKHKGTTFRDYTDSCGNKGSFQNKLKVYGRQGKTCVNCKTKLKQIRIGQRSSVFCPCCQR